MDTENQQTTLITEKQTQFWTEDCGFLTMQQDVLLNQCQERSPFLACSKLFEQFTEFTSNICQANTNPVIIALDEKQQEAKEQCPARYLKRRFFGIYKKHYKYRKSPKAKLIKQMEALTF